MAVGRHLPGHLRQAGIGGLRIVSRLVFIDTNTYLSFYRLSNSDINEMQKMLHAMASGELRVLLTDQVVDEYWRNREGVIAEALKKFREGRAPNQFPRLVHGYEELREIRKLSADLDKLVVKLAEMVEAAAGDKLLRADQLVAKVFQGAEVLAVTDQILVAARTRFDRGNPPGKSQSYGDAINWECLLHRTGSGEGLFVISGDGDFASKLQSSSISQFLEREWTSVDARGGIELFDTIGSFFKKYYPDIELEIEFEQNRFVDDLLESESFRATHAAIGQLDPLVNFTASQRQRIIDAGLTNGQVYSIGQDDDVAEFFQKFLGRHGAELDDEGWSHFKEYFEVTRQDGRP